MAKKKKGAAKGRMSGSSVALVASAALAVVLGGLIFWLKGRQERMDADLKVSITQYEQMKEMKKKLFSYGPKSKGGAKPAQKPEDDMTAYIGKTAKKVGLPESVIGNITYEGEKSSPPWKEFPISVTLNGTKDQPVPHTAFISFLETIEKERPYLKSKNLTLQFAQSDYSRVQATISWFRRD